MPEENGLELRAVETDQTSCGGKMNPESAKHKISGLTRGDELLKGKTSRFISLA